MARPRLLMLLGWAALAGGPLAGWALGRTDEAAVAYGGAPARWPVVLAAAAPGAVLAALLLLAGARGARARARRGLALGTADRLLAAASRLAGWACAAACALALGTAALLLAGPLALIGGLALAIVGFSLVGRGRTPAPGYRPLPGRPRDLGDPRNN